MTKDSRYDCQLPISFLVLIVSTSIYLRPDVTIIEICSSSITTSIFQSKFSEFREDIKTKKRLNSGITQTPPPPNSGNFTDSFRRRNHLRDFYLSKKTVQKNSGKGKPPLPNSGNARIETFF